MDDIEADQRAGLEAMPDLYKYFKDGVALLRNDDSQDEKKQWELFITTNRRITKYERARVLADRSAKLALGVASTIETGALSDPQQIAVLELQAGKLPLEIERQLPNQHTEIVKLNDLILDDD